MLFMFRLLRLQGYGITEAVVCLLAHRICGTPIYWYPKNERKGMKDDQSR